MIAAGRDEHKAAGGKVVFFVVCEISQVWEQQDGGLAALVVGAEGHGVEYEIHLGLGDAAALAADGRVEVCREKFLRNVDLAHDAGADHAEGRAFVDTFVAVVGEHAARHDGGEADGSSTEICLISAELKVANSELESIEGYAFERAARDR